MPPSSLPLSSIFLHKELMSIGRRNIPERFTTDTGIPLTPGHPPVDYRMAVWNEQRRCLERSIFSTSGACSGQASVHRPVGQSRWQAPPPPLPPRRIVRPPTNPGTILHPMRNLPGWSWCPVTSWSAWLPSITSFGPVLPCPNPLPGERETKGEGRHVDRII